MKNNQCDNIFNHMIIFIITTYLFTEIVMNNTYLTTEQLSERIHYHPRTIRVDLLDKHLFEGIHYIRAFGRKKYLFIWEEIEKTMCEQSDITIKIPTAQGVDNAS